MKAINEEILCAGQGGQGIMLMGKLLAYAAMKAGYQVTWIPSYGAEVRGGTAHSMVQIRGNRRIANPVVSRPTTCIVMNRLSLEKFMGRVKPGGLLLADSGQAGNASRRKDITIRYVPFTQKAVLMGDKRVANMIALGLLNKTKGLFSVEDLVKYLSVVFAKKPESIGINERALREGHGIAV